MPAYTTMPTTQQGIYNMPPQQQPATSYQSQGYGYPPMNCNYYSQGHRPAAPTTPVAVPVPMKKNMLKIIDPNTMKDISEEILSGKQITSQQEVTQDSGSRKTPVQLFEVNSKYRYPSYFTY